jgi:hypothetical protein
MGEARQIIEARLRRKLPPTRELPPDMRQAIKNLAIALIRARAARTPAPHPPGAGQSAGDGSPASLALDPDTIARKGQTP